MTDPLHPRRRRRDAAPTSDDAAPHYDDDSIATTGAAALAAGDFTRLALWMAATLAGLMSAALVAQGPFFRSLARRVGRGPPRGATGPSKGRKPTGEEALSILAEAIVGNSKKAVASVFGPPRGAMLAGAAPGPHCPAYPTPTFWQADTWYYALPRSGQLAVAIEFAEDSARRVQFLHAPAG